jgi:hypothetical protein
MYYWFEPAMCEFEVLSVVALLEDINGEVPPSGLEPMDNFRLRRHTGAMRG